MNIIVTVYEEVASNLNLFRGFLCSLERVSELSRTFSVNTLFSLTKELFANFDIAVAAYRRFSEDLQLGLDKQRVLLGYKNLSAAINLLSPELQVLQYEKLYQETLSVVLTAQEYLHSVLLQLCQYGCEIPCGRFPARTYPEAPKIIKVTHKDAEGIIEKRIPYGTFLLIDSPTCVVGIDNTTGDAWTEEFSSEEECEDWLLRCPMCTTCHEFNMRGTPPI